MELENSIKGVIAEKLADGSIEKLVGEQLEKGIVKALDNLLGSYGDVTKVIEKQIKSVMVPYLENYDYSKYIVKLDSVLVDVLKNSSLDNKKLLQNFKDLMVVDEEKKTIKVTELFKVWSKFVAKEVETDGLKVEYDCGVSYEAVDVSLEIEHEDRRSWSNFEYANLTLECDHDEKMNFEIRLNRWENDKSKAWDISYRTENTLSSLRYLNEFEIFLMKLDQSGVKLEMDKEYINDEITPNKEPEASYD